MVCTTKSLLKFHLRTRLGLFVMGLAHGWWHHQVVDHHQNANLRALGTVVPKPCANERHQKMEWRTVPLLAPLWLTPSELHHVIVIFFPSFLVGLSVFMFVCCVCVGRFLFFLGSQARRKKTAKGFIYNLLYIYKLQLLYIMCSCIIFFTSFNFFLQVSTFFYQ
jgi:hypothetical protein